MADGIVKINSRFIIGHQDKSFSVHSRDDFLRQSQESTACIGMGMRKLAHFKEQYLKKDVCIHVLYGGMYSLYNNLLCFWDVT